MFNYVSDERLSIDVVWMLALNGQSHIGAHYIDNEQYQLFPSQRSVCIHYFCSFIECFFYFLLKTLPVIDFIEGSLSALWENWKNAKQKQVKITRGTKYETPVCKWTHKLFRNRCRHTYCWLIVDRFLLYGSWKYNSAYVIIFRVNATAVVHLQRPQLR